MSYEIAIARFRRQFPYRVLCAQFPDSRHRAFIETWHAFPLASVRWCQRVSGLPAGSAVRLVRRLQVGFDPHVRGSFGFGCRFSSVPWLLPETSLHRFAGTVRFV